VLPSQVLGGRKSNEQNLLPSFIQQFTNQVTHGCALSTKYNSSSDAHSRDAPAYRVLDRVFIGKLDLVLRLSVGTREDIEGQYVLPESCSAFQINEIAP
jgi:hypothetical protein